MLMHLLAAARHDYRPLLLSTDQGVKDQNEISLFDPAFPQNTFVTLVIHFE